RETRREGYTMMTNLELHRRTRREAGYALISALVAMVLLLALAVAVATAAGASLQQRAIARDKEAAYWLAHAASEYATWQMTTTDVGSSAYNLGRTHPDNQWGMGQTQTLSLGEAAIPIEVTQPGSDDSIRAIRTV